MFLHVFVILSTGEGVPGQVHPQQKHPSGRYNLLAGTPSVQVHPPEQVQPPPGQVHTPGRYTPLGSTPPG